MDNSFKYCPHITNHCNNPPSLPYIATASQDCAVLEEMLQYLRCWYKGLLEAHDSWTTPCQDTLYPC